QIVLQLLHPIFHGRTVWIAYLRPAGDARLDGVPVQIVGYPLRQLTHEERPLGAGPDEAHVALQHVEDLRQLIDTKGADDFADARDTVVSLLRPLRRAGAFGVLAHAAEL